jgi:hypothetical protein
MAYTETDSFGSRAGKTLKRIVITLLVLGLGGAVAFLLSQLNSRTFSLEIQEGKLVVMKGRMFPVGSEPYRPSDPTLADTYAPLDLEGTTPTQVVGQRFTERDELDRALYSVIEGLAKGRVTSDDPQTLDSGLYYLRRADRLTTLTEDQRLSLKQMKQEVAYYQARGKLEEAQREIAEAMTQLRLAAQGNGRNARSANQMITTVEPPAKALEEALRSAVHTLSTPAGDAAPLQPQPEPVAPEPSKATPGSGGP